MWNEQVGVGKREECCPSSPVSWKRSDDDDAGDSGALVSHLIQQDVVSDDRFL